MSNLLIKQFELVRGNVLKSAESTSKEMIDIQPKGFNNTLHWHFGHILTTSEKFLFDISENGQISARYVELFGYGSKPENWTGEVPSVETLIEQLKQQLERIKEIPEERFNEALPEPLLGASTFGELVSTLIFHETFHYGQVHAMKKVITAS